MRIGVNCYLLRPGIGGLRQYFHTLINWLLENDSANEYILFWFPQNADDLEQIRSEKWRENAIQLADQVEVHRHIGKIDLYFCPLGSLWPRPLPLPTVIMLPDIQEVFYPQFFAAQDLLTRQDHFRGSAAMTDRLVTLSEYSKSTIHEHYGVSNDRIIVAPLAPAPDQFLSGAAGSQPDCHLPDSDYLFYPADRWHHKNHEVLLQSLRILKTQGLRVPLLLTGHDQPHGFQAAERTRELGLEDQVWDAGYVSPEQLVYLYRRCRMVAIPSLFEGFGLPVLEAMALDRPVAASKATSLPEVGGDAVSYFDPNSPENVAEVIGNLWSDEGLRRRLAEAGRRRTREFSVEKMAANHIKAFREAFDRFSWRRYFWQKSVTQRIHRRRLHKYASTMAAADCSAASDLSLMARYTSGWYPPDAVDGESIYWSSGKGVLEVVSASEAPALLSVRIYTVDGPNEATIKVNGRKAHVCRFEEEGFGIRELDGVEIDLKRGGNRIEIRSKNRASAQPNDARSLAVAIANLQIRSREES